MENLQRYRLTYKASLCLIEATSSLQPARPMKGQRSGGLGRNKNLSFIIRT